jgi:hypothetical protein
MKVYNFGVKGNPHQDGYSSNLYNFYKNCDIDTPRKAKDTYKELCSEIHGYPWDGLNVKVFFQQISKGS